MSNEHALKISMEHYVFIKQGVKTFEIRKNDRCFRVGDILVLREYVTEVGYTGNEIKVDVTHILYGGKFGLAPGYIIMSIKKRI